MTHFLGLEAVTAEFEELGMIGLVVLLILGNVTFMLLDLVLTRLSRRKR